MKLVSAALAAVLACVIPATAQDKKCETIEDSIEVFASAKNIAFLGKVLTPDETAKWAAEAQKAGVLSEGQRLPHRVLIVIPNTTPFLAIALGYGEDGCAFGSMRQPTGRIVAPLAKAVGVTEFKDLGFALIAPREGA